MKKRNKSLDWHFLRATYHRLSKRKKGKRLDELCDIYDFNRKYLLQALNNLTGKRHLRRGPKIKYNPKIILRPLERIWLATDQMCGKRLKAAMPLWLPYYEEEYEELSKEIKELLLSVSHATIDRLLKSVKAQYKRRRRSGTKPGSIIKSQIPIRTGNEDIDRPGFVEADTVAHCGDSIKGNFIWSMTLTDIHTGWTEIRAVWNKEGKGMIQQIKNIEKSIPFVLLGFDSDNGSEFLNHYLMEYFKMNTDNPRVPLTRSRPYHKNDNAHVEQKNWTHVRQLFGYNRLDEPGLVKLMNALYSNEWSLLQNYFCPSTKLVKKTRIGSKYHKVYENPRTPFQRILDSSTISESKKQELIAIQKNLNPFRLQKQIQNRLKGIFKYVKVHLNPRTKI